MLHTRNLHNAVQYSSGINIFRTRVTLAKLNRFGWIRWMVVNVKSWSHAEKKTNHILNKISHTQTTTHYECWMSALGEPPFVVETNKQQLKTHIMNSVNTSNEGFLIWTLRPSDKYLTWNKSEPHTNTFNMCAGNVDNNESFRDFWLVFLLTNVDELYPRIY